ncbi:SpoIIE family protein phosphatase, partial [candidate division KSB1 bacterium]
MFLSNVTLGIIKEIFVLILLFASIPVIKNFILPWFEKNRYIAGSKVLVKLKFLIFSALSILLTFIISGMLLPRDNNRFLEGIYNSFILNLILSGLISFIVCGLCIIIIFTLYDLITFRRSRFAVVNFRILGFLFLIFLFWMNYGGYSSGIIPKELYSSRNDSFISVLTLLSIFVISLKSPWVVFLNRKQKLAVLAGLFITSILMILAYNSSMKNIIPYFSLSAGSLQILTITFFFVYASFSIIKILIHLPGAGVFDTKVRQLSSLHQLSKSAASALDIDKLLVEIVNHTYNITRSDCIWLLIRNDEKSSFTIGASKDIHPEDKNLADINPDSFLNSKIIESRSSLILNELEREAYFYPAKGSLIGIPLISTNLGFIGILYAKKKSTYGYSEDDDFILNAFANHAVSAIENALYFQDSIEKKELEKELAVAKKIQETLFPKHIPDFSSIEIATLNVPCKEIGGDYYDLIKIDDDRLGIAIADVSGKGIPASLLMANLQACLRSLSRENLSVKDITARINNIIFENTDDYQYITFFYAELDMKRHIITYCNAGHNPPILFREDDSEILLKDGGIVL